jgi:outer membrane murein-binding lipoprotein Lpp
VPPVVQESCAKADPAAPSRQRSFTRLRLAQAAVIALAVGGGWLAARALPDGQQAAVAPLTEAVRNLQQGQEDVLRLTGDVRALKAAVEALKEGIDRTRAESHQKQAQVVERAERGSLDTASRLARLGEQVDRVETAVREPAAKVAALGDRLDRMEKQLAALAAPKVTPAAATGPEPVQTASVPAKPAERDTPVEGWVLHEVYDGIALIEGRRGRFMEVGRGDTVPGVGRVESIERRAKRWVVVTNRGVIDTVR